MDLTGDYCFLTGDTIIDDIVFNNDEVDDNDYFRLVATSCIAAVIAENEPKHHSSFYVHDQMEWFSHVEELKVEGDGTLDGTCKLLL